MEEQKRGAQDHHCGCVQRLLPLPLGLGTCTGPNQRLFDFTLLNVRASSCRGRRARGSCAARTCSVPLRSHRCHRSDCTPSSSNRARAQRTPVAPSPSPPALFSSWPCSTRAAAAPDRLVPRPVEPVFRSLRVSAQQGCSSSNQRESAARAKHVVRFNSRQPSQRTEGCSSSADVVASHLRISTWPHLRRNCSACFPREKHSFAIMHHNHAKVGCQAVIPAKPSCLLPLVLLLL